MVFLSATAGDFWSRIVGWDQALFVSINTRWTGSFLDKLMPLLRDQRTWYPLYALLLVYVLWKFRWKALPFVLLAALTVGLTNEISSSFLKDFVGRVRPCHEEALAGIMKLRVGYCPHSGSFTSSHAVNHFGMAIFFFLCLRPYLGRWAWLFFPWAAFICYAQVYVGVHYPGDVLGGAVLGLLLGGLTAMVFRRWFNFGVRRKGRRAGAEKGIATSGRP